MPMMNAKYAGTCKKCGKRIQVGERQLYEGGYNVWHEACAPQGWTALPQPAERGTTVTRIRGALYRPDGSAREIGDIILIPTVAQQAWNLPPYIVLKAADPGPDETLMLDVVPASAADAAKGATTGAPPAQAVAGALAMAGGGAPPAARERKPTYLDYDGGSKEWFWTGPRESNDLIKDSAGKWILQASFYDEYLRDSYGSIIMDERTGKPKRKWKRWQTKYPEAAVKLKEYATPNALRALEGHVQAVEASKATDAELSCPSPPGWNYRPYQRAGIRYAMDRASCLIGDAPGVGKTNQALGVINCSPEAQRVLVICPNTATGNWAGIEAPRWLVGLWTIWSPKTGKDETPNTAGRLLVITGYGKLSRKSAFLESLFKVQWDILVVDESHKVKNLESVRGKNVIGEMKKGQKKPQGGLVSRAKRVLFMSGTPIPNNPAEIWPTLVSLAPDEFKSQLSFGIRYGGWRMEYNDFVGKEIPVKPTVKQLANPVVRDQLIPLSRREELQERMRACCMIRRTLEEAIPEMEGRKQRHIMVLPTPPELAKDKDLAWSGNINDALNLDTEDINIVFTTVSKKRELIARLKAPLVVEHVRNLLDSGVQKVIVFGFHHVMLDALGEGLTSAPDEKDEDAGETVLRPEQVLRIDGSVPTAQRSGKGSIAEKFQEDPEARVIILQWEAASEAINLFAANYVVITEAPWTPTTVDQMEGRAYRSGQEKVVISQFLVFDHTVEALLVKLLLAKMEIAKGIMDKPTASTTGPSIGQLLADAGVRQSEQVAATAAQEALKAREATESQAAREAAQAQQREQIAAMPEGKEKQAALREAARERADQLTPEQILTVVHAARSLADSDYDRAKEKNDVGYNKLDGPFGHQLAGAIPSELPPRLAWAGAKMLIKYKGQLARDVWESLYQIVYGGKAPSADAPTAKALERARKLRAKADALAKEASDAVVSIPMGHKIVSVADRNRRERSGEKMRKAGDLVRQAEHLEGKHVEPDSLCEMCQEIQDPGGRVSTKESNRLLAEHREGGHTGGVVRHCGLCEGVERLRVGHAAGNHADDPREDCPLCQPHPKRTAAEQAIEAELAKVLTPEDVAELEREEVPEPATPEPTTPEPTTPAAAPEKPKTLKVKEEIGTQCNECGWTTKRIGARKCGACDGDDMMAPLYKVREATATEVAARNEKMGQAEALKALKDEADRLRKGGGFRELISRKDSLEPNADKTLVISLNQAARENNGHLWIDAERVGMFHPGHYDDWRETEASEPRDEATVERLLSLAKAAGVKVVGELPAWKATEPSGGDYDGSEDFQAVLRQEEARRPGPVSAQAVQDALHDEADAEFVASGHGEGVEQVQTIIARAKPPGPHNMAGERKHQTRTVLASWKDARKKVIHEFDHGDYSLWSLVEDDRKDESRPLYVIINDVLFKIVDFRSWPRVQAQMPKEGAALITLLQENVRNPKGWNPTTREAWAALGLPPEEFEQRVATASAAREQREQEREQKRADDEARQKQREDESFTKLREIVREGGRIAGVDLLGLARKLGIEVHPRTAHALKETNWISATQAERAKGGSASIWVVYRQVREVIAGEAGVTPEDEAAAAELFKPGGTTAGTPAPPAPTPAPDFSFARSGYLAKDKVPDADTQAAKLIRRIEDAPDPDEAHDQGEHDDVTEPVPGCGQCAKQFSPEARAERLAEAHEDGDHRDAYEPVPGCAKCAKRFEKIAASQRISDGPEIRLSDWQVSVLEDVVGEVTGADGSSRLEDWVKGVFGSDKLKGRGRLSRTQDWVFAEDEGPEDDPGVGPELRHWWKFTLLPWAVSTDPKKLRGTSTIKAPGTPQAREELWQALRSLVEHYREGLGQLRGIAQAHALEAVKATEALAQKVIALSQPEQPDLTAGLGALPKEREPERVEKPKQSDDGAKFADQPPEIQAAIRAQMVRNHWKNDAEIIEYFNDRPAYDSDPGPEHKSESRETWAARLRFELDLDQRRPKLTDKQRDAARGAWWDERIIGQNRAAWKKEAPPLVRPGWTWDESGTSFRRGDGALVVGRLRQGNWSAKASDGETIYTQKRVKGNQTRIWFAPEVAMDWMDKEFPVDRKVPVLAPTRPSALSRVDLDAFDRALAEALGD